jgi:hypothetical protein
MPEGWEDELSDEDFITDWATPDQFGVPFNLMGRHPEEFFSMLGRVVTLSASLENHLLVIYQSLVGAAQNEFTGVPVGKLLKRCRRELHRLDGRPDDRQLMEDFLAKAEEITERRNHYVHNLWPAQPGGRLFGWRPPREQGVQEAITIESTLEEMNADLASLVEVLEVRHWHRLLSIASSAQS